MAQPLSQYLSAFVHVEGLIIALHLAVAVPEVEQRGLCCLRYVLLAQLRLAQVQNLYTYIYTYTHAYANAYTYGYTFFIHVHIHARAREREREGGREREREGRKN